VWFVLYAITVSKGLNTTSCGLNLSSKLDIYQIVCDGLYTSGPQHSICIVNFFGESNWTFKINVEFFMWVDETQVVCRMCLFWCVIARYNI